MFFTSTCLIGIHSRYHLHHHHHPLHHLHLRSIIFLFFLISLPNAVQSSKIDPLLEFSNNEVIGPFNLTDPSLKTSTCPNKLFIKFNAFNRTFKLRLIKNKDLISPNYFEQHHSNGTLVTGKPTFRVEFHCHYHGEFNGLDSWSAISTYANTYISGVIAIEEDIYYLHYDDHRKKNFIFRGQDFNSTQKLRCGVNDDDTPNIKHFLHKRDLKVHEPYGSDGTKSRYVELIIVNDHKEFIESKKDKAGLIEKNKQIANIVNALYNHLNIFIALVGVVIWSEKDEIELSSDGDTTLTSFLHYRRERLLPYHPNDNAQLITGASFNGGVVGKALKGPICTFEYSGGVNTDHSHIIGLVATTVAHELGHNFGMEHDDSEKCNCPDQRCIMAPSSSATSPRHWSSCSKRNLEFAFAHGMDHCLKNLPSKLTSPVCGNGFLEDGEECDCGLKNYCDNHCCNATTCKLFPGAECATGSCCDMSSCKVFKPESQKICRKSESECDLAEICDGESEFCGEDVHVQNGRECQKGKAYCYDGSCRTHNDQCQLLWGESGEMSDRRCFEQNIRGNGNGNCGYMRLNQTFKSCKTKDVLCGMLMCIHINEKLEYGMESAAILSQSFITTRGDILTCRSAIVDLGLDTIDPGLVPNGARCGQDKMCVNQQCVPVSSVLVKSTCENDCNGNGLCDNRGTCHCFSGYAMPYCEYPIPSGYHLTIALYIIFLCILPLTGVTAFIFYYFHGHFKTWWLMKARKAAIKSRAKEVQRKPSRLPHNFDIRSLEISEPIPLDNSNVTAIATLPRSFGRNKNTTDKINIRNLEISGPIINQNDSPQPFKPIRPAPPPPQTLRSASFRSSTRSNRDRPLSVPPPRPTVPPPPRPRPRNPDVFESLENTPADLALDFKDTKLSFVHEKNKDPHQGLPLIKNNDIKSTNLRSSYKKNPAPSIPFSNNTGIRTIKPSLGTSTGKTDTNSKVANLAQRFECLEKK